MSLAPQVQPKTIGENELVSASWVGKLHTGEKIASIVSVTEVTTSDLTISNQSVSTAILELNDLSVPIGEAEQYSVSGGLVANSPYKITTILLTDSTPARRLHGTVTLEITADDA